MRCLLLTVFLIYSVFATAQKSSCDSVVIAMKSLVPKYIKDSSNLVLVYKRGDFVIKVPRAELLKDARLMGMTEKEMANNIEFTRSINIERDSQNFNFSSNAEFMVCTFLYYKNCYVSIGKHVLMDYLAIGYRSKSCMKYSRYVFKDGYYVERSYID